MKTRSWWALWTALCLTSALDASADWKVLLDSKSLEAPVYKDGFGWYGGSQSVPAVYKDKLRIEIRTKDDEQAFDVYGFTPGLGDDQPVMTRKAVKAELDKDGNKTGWYVVSEEVTIGPRPQERMHFKFFAKRRGSFVVSIFKEEKAEEK